MGARSFDTVTGAFGYIGRYIAAEALARGRTVQTFTRRSGEGTPLAGKVRVVPQDFDDEDFLREHLRGCDVLYNTYWVRFDRGAVTFEGAIERSTRLFAAARDAGVRRIVHVSVTNCTEDSKLPYYAGKARVERALEETGISHAIVRPTLVFGVEDILVNNIVWMLRTMPLFAVPGRGRYRVQPIFVEDVARLCVDAAARTQDETFDAAGPDIMTYAEMVRLLRTAIRSRRRIVYLPAWLALLLCRLVSVFVRDVILTRDELDGLRQEMLVSAEPPRGTLRLETWLADAAEALGTSYSSELDRHFRIDPISRPM